MIVLLVGVVCIGAVAAAVVVFARTRRRDPGASPVGPGAAGSYQQGAGYPGGPVAAGPYQQGAGHPVLPHQPGYPPQQPPYPAAPPQGYQQGQAQAPGQVPQSGNPYLQQPPQQGQ
ncbi:hypothetical protein SUDANB145_01940 [Streptomyces sp. enrichment culture]